jgi:Tfp pilus assembly protein PilO
MVSLNKILPRIQFTLNNLGWYVLLGSIFWIASIWMAYTLVDEFHKGRNIEAEFAQPLQRTVLNRRQLGGSDLAQRFYSVLPKKNEIDELSKVILLEADGMGLQFERAEFNEIKNSDSVLMQHQIKLPVRGSYVQVRQFLNRLLNTQPALALTEFQVQRKDVLSDLVDANLVLTIYLRGE